MEDESVVWGKFPKTTLPSSPISENSGKYYNAQGHLGWGPIRQSEAGRGRNRNTKFWQEGKSHNHFTLTVFLELPTIMYLGTRLLSCFFFWSEKVSEG